MGEHHSPAPSAFNRQDPRIATRKLACSLLMMLHDEVRERPAVLRPIDEAKRHSRALVGVLDAHDFGRKMEALLAGEIDLELGDRSRSHPLGRAQKQPAARDILDETVDDDPSAPALGPDVHRDSNRFPLVHLLKGTLHTHGLGINSFFVLTEFAVAPKHGGPTEITQLALHSFVPSCRLLRLEGP